jgi:site-specific DNA recombinase
MVRERRRKAVKTVKKIEVTRPVLPTRKKVAAYARVSMETDRMMHSISTQVSYYSELIQSNPEWEYAGVYADNFISGTAIDRRPEFKRLLEDCEAGKIDIVLTKSISRFARNTVDLLETVRHLKELGIEVQFEKKDFDTANLSRKSKIEQNTPRYATILCNIKRYF